MGVIGAGACCHIFDPFLIATLPWRAHNGPNAPLSIANSVLKGLCVVQEATPKGGPLRQCIVFKPIQSRQMWKIQFFGVIACAFRGQVMTVGQTEVMTSCMNIKQVWRSRVNQLPTSGYLQFSELDANRAVW